MDSVSIIDKRFIETNTDFGELVERLKSSFADPSTVVPKRHHHDFPNPDSPRDTTMLLMPAWHPGNHAGVKIVSVNPGNAEKGLPSVQGVYVLLDASNGELTSIVDAKSLTTKRTAAASALASTFLSRPDSTSLLMIGTGALSPNLIRAHAAVRPIESVYVWGRNPEKAVSVCQSLSNETFSIEPVVNIEDKITEVDIVSCATLSTTSLVNGADLREGQHIDLVGAYKADMRESDDTTMARGTIFLDSFQSGLDESGDILIPLQNGTIERDDILADLFQLCSGLHTGRSDAEQITVFKSVGHALEDLSAATYYYEMQQRNQNS